MLQNLLLIREHAACLVSSTMFMAFGWVFACFLPNRLSMWSNLYLMVSWWTSVASLNVICITCQPACVMCAFSLVSAAIDRYQIPSKFTQAVLLSAETKIWPTMTTILIWSQEGHLIKFSHPKSVWNWSLSADKNPRGGQPT